MKTAILDCDGVLLSWRGAFNQWLVDHKFLENLDIWDMSEYAPPIDDVERTIKIFNQTHFIRNLPVIPGAVRGVESLREAGYSLKVCTSFSYEYEAMRMREENLINHFGDVFTEIMSLPIGEDKKKFLSRHLSDETIYIEDHPGHIKDALNIGYKPNQLFLIPHAYNTSIHPFVNRINWHLIKKSVI